jgi:hypothetical protein
LTWGGVAEDRLLPGRPLLQGGAEVEVETRMWAVQDEGSILEREVQESCVLDERLPLGVQDPERYSDDSDALGRINFKEVVPEQNCVAVAGDGGVVVDDELPPILEKQVRLVRVNGYGDRETAGVRQFLAEGVIDSHKAELLDLWGLAEAAGMRANEAMAAAKELRLFQ